ncbi:hypothetical protein HDV00_003125 [Rhizophlyctis rosea]|nr:hypothetical protein HDV00_003125 [Rhizophlyctis rosea]
MHATSSDEKYVQGRKEMELMDEFAKVRGAKADWMVSMCGDVELTWRQERILKGSSDEEEVDEEQQGGSGEDWGGDGAIAESGERDRLRRVEELREVRKTLEAAYRRIWGST